MAWTPLSGRRAATATGTELLRSWSRSRAGRSSCPPSTGRRRSPARRCGSSPRRGPATPLVEPQDLDRHVALRSWSCSRAGRRCCLPSTGRRRSRARRCGGCLRRWPARRCRARPGDRDRHLLSISGAVSELAEARCRPSTARRRSPARRCGRRLRRGPGRRSPSPGTGTGTALSVVELFPSWPSAFAAPALDAAVHQRAGVVVARGDGLHAARRGPATGPARCCSTWSCSRARRWCCPPALDAAVHQRAGVVVARGDGLHAAAEAPDRDGHVALGRGVVPELAVGVVPPALDAAVHERAGVVVARGDGLHAAPRLPRPWTATGTWLSVVELFPSWPLPLSPQHWTPPFTSAQVWS